MKNMFFFILIIIIYFSCLIGASGHRSVDPLLRPTLSVPCVIEKSRYINRFRFKIRTYGETVLYKKQVYGNT